VTPPSPAIVLPVKRFDRAKHRLSEVLAPAERRALMEAMLGDVVAALGRLRAAHHLLVVTSERRAAHAVAGLDAEVIPDGAEPGHSQAAAVGIAHCVRQGVKRVLLVAGDCPLLDPAAVDELLVSPQDGSSRVGLVTDRAGEGTNALLLDPPTAISPAFGPGSRERHRQAAAARGIPFETLDIPSLQLDVDTPEDLAALGVALDRRPGSAPRTSAVLQELAAVTEGVR
jgi:2-phospho-L-lactate guanylyltransferase